MKTINNIAVFNPETEEYTYDIPKGYTAEIKDGKVIVRAKEPEMTEFERGIRKFVCDIVSLPRDLDGMYMTSDLVDTIERHKEKLLSLAKKELCKGCSKHLDGYCLGREDTLREMKDFVESHFTSKKAREDVMIAPNTNSGTSDLVAHGNVANKYGEDSPYIVADGKLENNEAI